MTSVTIAYGAPVADQMLVEVAAHAGFFAKNGINANVEFLQQSLMLPSMVAGQVQFGVLGAPGPEVASVGGTPLEYIGQWENVLDADILAGPGVGSPVTANGKSIAISSAGALSDFLVQIYDHKYNVKMTEVPLGSLPNELASFGSGSVKAIAGVSPWQVAQLQSEEPGSHVMFDFRTDKGFPGQGLVVDKNWVGSHSGTAIKVLTALIEAMKYYRTHPTQVEAIIQQYTSQTPAQAAQAFSVTKGLLTSTMVPALAAQEKTLKNMVFNYPAAAGFNAKQLLNTTYASKAEAAANPKKKNKKNKKK